MNWERVVKWMGFGCILAGIARMGMTPSSLIWGLDSMPEVTSGLIACILMAVFSLAFYLVQSRETGITGFITVLWIMIGNALTACILWGLIAYGSYSDEDALIKTITNIVMGIGVLGGALLLPILSWRAKVFPRWVVVLQVLMPVSMAIPMSEFFAFFWGLSYVGMGYCIWTGKLNTSKSG